MTTERQALVERLAKLADERAEYARISRCPDESCHDCATWRALRDAIEALSSSAPVETPQQDPYATFAALQPNWDSHGAAPIDARAIEAAKAFEAALCRVPACNGGVQLEWHQLGIDLELAIAADGTVESVYAKHPEWEIEGPPPKPSPADPPIPSSGDEARKDEIAKLQSRVVQRLVVEGCDAHSDSTCPDVWPEAWAHWCIYCLVGTFLKALSDYEIKAGSK